MKLIFSIIFFVPFFAFSQANPNSKDTFDIKLIKSQTIKDTSLIQPEFPGGEEELYNFLAQNVRYPYYERKKNMEAKVILSFIVDENGDILVGKVENKSEVSEGFVDESLRILALMPQWIPGYYHGEPVPFKYTIPLTFKLQ